MSGCTRWSSDIPDDLLQDCGCLRATYEAGGVPDDDCSRCYGTGRCLPAVHVVILAVADEAQLAWIDHQLVRADIPHVTTREPDAPYCGAMTAIGVLPVRDRRGVRHALSGLELLS